MPDPITDQNGNTPTALELIYDLIIANTPGCVPGTDVTLAYNRDTPGIVRYVSEAPGTSYDTYGRAVALEEPLIRVEVRGDPTDYAGPKREALRLRYIIAGSGEFTSRGLRMLAANQRGTLSPLGRDPDNREAFELLFDVMTDPSYE